MEQWHFHVVMEAIPAMLQVALALLGSGLSLYLWSINRTVAGIVMATALFGFSFYTFLTLAAIFVYNCPYQTPPSYAIQSLVRYILRRHHGVVKSLSLIFHALKVAGLTFARLFKRLRSAIFALCRSPSPVVGPEDMPLAAVVEPTRIFDGALADSTNHEADARCVAWVLYFTTDKDVILPSVRFAADIALYPAIATIVPTHVLADLFFECFSGWEIAAGKLDQARSAGMALASVLSVQLCLDPGSQMRELLERMHIMDWFRMEDHTANLVVETLCLVAGPPPQLFQGSCLAYPDNPASGAIRRPDWSQGTIATTFKSWMTRILLQRVWRWRQDLSPDVIISMSKVKAFFLASLDRSDPLPISLKTTVVLTLAVALGQMVHLDDLFVPAKKSVISPEPCSMF